MDVSVFRRTEGVYLVSPDPAYPPPYLGLVGSLHGNEPCGLEVIQGLLRIDHPLRARLVKGTLVLIHGNPPATAVGRRHTDGGVDLNRLFDFAFETELPRDAWTTEHWRAHALKPILGELDAVLDLHSTTSPSAPFVITGPSWLPMAARLGCPFVTFGWDAPGLLQDRVLIGPMHKRNKPAFSVECGQHQDPVTPDVAWGVTERYLELMGLLSADAPGEPIDCKIIQVLHRVGKPTVNFRFRRPFEGFESLVAGEDIGEGDGVRLGVDGTFRILLPNHDVAVGQDMLYLGQELPASSHRGAA